MKRIIFSIYLIFIGLVTMAQNGGSNNYKLSADDARYNTTPTLTDPLQFASVGMVNDLLSPGVSKEQCVAATIAAITLSGEQTIDGYAVITGNRVLVKNQANSAHNGVYVVSSSTWSRSTDMDTWAEIYHSSVFVSHGTVNTGSIFSSGMTETGTLDSDPVVWNLTNKQVLQDLSGSGASLSGYVLTLSGDDSDVTLPNETYLLDSAWLKENVRELIASGGSGSQDLSSTKTGTKVSLSITGGTGTSFSVADDDSSQTNEIQNLSYTASTRVLAIDGIGSTDVTLPLVGTNAGLMSSTDYTKLAGIEANANYYVHPTADGYHHVPATGTTNNGRVLMAGATAGSETWQPVSMTTPYPSAGIAVSTGLAWGTSLTDNSSNWNSAYTDRLKWDGGATGLVAATGRASLGLVIGTDVLAPTGSAANLTNFPILNQNTTGTASNITGTLAVANGGTGRTTGTTAYSLIATGTTATGVQQSLPVGAITEILVGGGSSALPVWTTATGSGAPVRATTPTITSPSFATSSTFSYSTTNTVSYFNASKQLVSSSVTPTELSYLSGVTGGIQGQLNNKQATLSGLGIVKSTSGAISYLTDNSSNWDNAYTYRLTSASGTNPLTLTLSANSLTGSIATAADNVLGVVKTSIDGGLSMISGYIVQNDSKLTSATPASNDLIAFWDVTGNAQRNMTLTTLGGLVGGSGGVGTSSDGEVLYNSAGGVDGNPLFKVNSNGGTNIGVANGTGAESLSAVTIACSGGESIPAGGQMCSSWIGNLGSRTGIAFSYIGVVASSVWLGKIIGTVYNETDDTYQIVTYDLFVKGGVSYVMTEKERTGSSAMSSFAITCSIGSVGFYCNFSNFGCDATDIIHCSIQYIGSIVSY